MNFDTVITCDPGASGAATVRTLERVLGVINYENRQSYRDAVSLATRSPSGTRGVVAVVEHVWATPVMLPQNAFSFGGSFNGWIVAAYVHGIPVYVVTPQKWQRIVVPHITSNGDARKRDLRDAAKALFDLPITDSVLPPKTGITLDNCDSLLLSEYALRKIRANEPLGDLVP